MSRGVPRKVIDMLRAVPLFSSCNTAELREIAGLGTPVHARAGRALTTQGKPGSEFFLILSGDATCTIDGRTVAEFGPGDYFGELAILGRTPRTATVTSDTEMELEVFNAREFRTMIEDSPSVALKMLNRLADRLRELETAHTD